MAQIPIIPGQAGQLPGYRPGPSQTGVGGYSSPGAVALAYQAGAISYYAAVQYLMTHFGYEQKEAEELLDEGPKPVKPVTPVTPVTPVVEPVVEPVVGMKRIL